MMVGDTIGDFIIRLKNAGMVGKKEVSVPYSKLRHAIADKLVAAGYIEKAEQQGKKDKVQKTLAVTLKYEGGKHRINGVKRVSKPGRRLYTKVADIHRVKFGNGHMILSTPAGILTNEEARTQNVGGEQLFIIW
ncbi:30S ribosomal protein S8 [Candidatus Kaiserbacteria bacterium RIFCSPLOWO2_02_FULL_45_11b]|uniref:Small ribosomal subunit protein uS8 n=1 Tax=Candidatus Kaiserbacteria bacterium RIFCSPLOWO2_12_FULL_45_26 TaxID=1798525 RepID=A0A1F6FFT9_9BACT|nr:MAG: 30S ribosomal protein S8 [Candidatus Kaiserbacteria bacterium RIFCSPHIGHO2_12_45_16]OGG70446.1 MAG: 30S ribosomal protein S8 [Candidatus Kaiserbacteria bacterium RIFCSPLOWO2_01_FULL_45_25]OGG80977.1 MAG: 30S ribosomal protein S8 [Candidatus Kaiserbacteria bacterium RIFCSPLOWO2_02_FULL_45_11b]OGG84718.1 MAG: 30S ribosomal protein S8 [Candidatus Kaiserbacteria bacterium RIFCSPLOWO2_12_FULL_45_26]